jgi:hypothetical protein
MKWQPLKAKATPITPFFDGGCIGAPNEGTSSSKRELAAGRLEQTHREPMFLDLMPWLMLSWQ